MGVEAIQVALAPTPSPELTEALRALDALEANMVRRQRAAAQPRPRRFELTPERLDAAPSP